MEYSVQCSVFCILYFFENSLRIIILLFKDNLVKRRMNDNPHQSVRSNVKPTFRRVFGISTGSLDIGTVVRGNSLIIVR